MKYRNLSHSADVLTRRIHFFFGKRNILFARWWGVVLGRKTGFDGKCYFKRYPGSKITIGKRCKFLSRPNSNLIGINHACIISTLTPDAIIEIGDDCGFSGNVIGAFKLVKIGNNVRCGANAVITDSDWHPEDTRSGNPRDVIIGNNVWLGANATILKGVSIGDNSLIGANSVVTKDIPSNVIAAGNPCRVIKNLV
jgi:acetyltransferase-like isoleucine patch superfamily enzyme